MHLSSHSHAFTCFILYTGSPYRDLLSDAILKLQEDQILQMLYNEWWKEKGGAGQCKTDEGKKNANALAITHVGGVFVVLVAGLVLSLIVALLEFVWKANKIASEHPERVSIGTKQTLTFIITIDMKDNKLFIFFLLCTHPLSYSLF